MEWNETSSATSCRRALLAEPNVSGVRRVWREQALMDWPKIPPMRGALAIESRSLALHVAVARRLVDTPELWKRARERILSWRESKSVHAHFLSAWDDLIEASPGQIAEAIVDPGERGRRLRRASPFAFVLTSKERWATWRAARRSEESGEEALHP